MFWIKYTVYCDFGTLLPPAQLSVIMLLWCIISTVLWTGGDFTRSHLGINPNIIIYPIAKLNV